MGYLVSSYDFFFAFIVIPVAFFGDQFHRPRALGIGLAVFAIGCFLWSLPQFVSDDYEPVNSGASSFIHSKRESSNNALMCLKLFLSCAYFFIFDTLIFTLLLDYLLCDPSSVEVCSSENYDSLVGLFLLAQVRKMTLEQQIFIIVRFVCFSDLSSFLLLVFSFSSHISISIFHLFLFSSSST